MVADTDDCAKEAYRTVKITYTREKAFMPAERTTASLPIMSDERKAYQIETLSRLRKDYNRPE